MIELKGFQKKYLRGLAHGLDPVVFIGQHGLTDSVTKSIEEALEAHELIKVKFNDYKEKEQKKEISGEIEKNNKCTMVGMIGHISIFFRQKKRTEKRKIKIPREKKVIE